MKRQSDQVPQGYYQGTGGGGTGGCSQVFQEGEGEGEGEGGKACETGRTSRSAHTPNTGGDKPWKARLGLDLRFPGQLRCR